MDKRGGEGRIVEPTMGVTLQPCAHNFDSDKVVIMFGALWVPMVRRSNTNY